jgi:ribosome maturation factor RimP
MLKETVEQLLQSALEERQDLFLIDFSFSADNNIKVIIDGDNGVMVDDCIYISRAIEHNIDREEHDFSLEVLSSGASSPLRFPRQYNKHVGRDLEVKTCDDNFEGKLTQVDEEAIELQWKTREHKPTGKGKVTITKTHKIDFKDIEQAKVKIKF